MSRAPIILVLAALSLAAACGADYPGAPGTLALPSPLPGDIDIPAGASARTTTAFAPNPQQLALDGGSSLRVRWVNADPGVAHMIVSDEGSFTASSPVSPGATYSVDVGQPGTYHYHCGIHPNMVGTLIVAP